MPSVFCTFVPARVCRFRKSRGCAASRTASTSPECSVTLPEQRRRIGHKKMLPMRRFIDFKTTHTNATNNYCIFSLYLCYTKTDRSRQINFARPVFLYIFMLSGLSLIMAYRCHHTSDKIFILIIAPRQTYKTYMNDKMYLEKLCLFEYFLCFAA